MASPQKENGFTAIANEILERLVKTALLGSEFQVLYFLIRKTYGYNKKSDRISLTQFELGTGLSRPTIVKTLKNLMARKMIVKVVLPDEGVEYSFEKDHEKWVVKTAKLEKHKNEAQNRLKNIGSKTILTSKAVLTRGGKAVLTETSKDGLTHKRHKEIYKDNTAETSSASLVSEVIKLFEEVNPACKTYYANRTQRKACENLIETYGFEEVSRVIAFLPKSNKMAYVPTINTPLQLWEKYQALKDGLQRKKGELTTKGKGFV